jgi:hypothetical protein
MPGGLSPSAPFSSSCPRPSLSSASSPLFSEMQVHKKLTNLCAVLIKHTSIILMELTMSDNWLASFTFSKGSASCNFPWAT